MGIVSAHVVCDSTSKLILAICGFSLKFTLSTHSFTLPLSGQ